MSDLDATITADRVINTLRAHMTELRSAGIRHLSLFGSVARGEAGPDSDIDLAVELDRNAHVTLITLSAMERRLSEILGRRVDILPEPAQRPRLRASLERDRRCAF